MAESKYDKYIIRSPKVVNVAYHPIKEVKGVTFPDEIYLDSNLVKGTPLFIDIGWRFQIPEPDPVEWTHTHDFDEVLNFIGTDPENPHDLGAEVEMQLGDEKHTINTTTSIFIPKGLPHCPMSHKRVDRPYLLVVVALNDQYPTAAEDVSINPEKYEG